MPGAKGYALSRRDGDSKGLARLGRFGSYGSGSPTEAAARSIISCREAETECAREKGRPRVDVMVPVLEGSTGQSKMTGRPKRIETRMLNSLAPVGTFG
jgi:hypothetical protein